ncbi:MAG: LysR family transcriptional regulator, partial [Alcaligenaceae bacterium]
MELLCKNKSEILILLLCVAIMDPFDINVRLLLMFDEVYRGRSVSKAAERLGISQPSLSLGLNKLRAHFDDPLFVRTSRGMDPTPYADQLISQFRGAIDLLKQALEKKQTFDPATSDRNFRI